MVILEGMSLRILSLMLFSLFVWVSPGVSEQCTSPSEYSDEIVHVQFISDTEQIVPGMVINLGLLFKLQKDWHIYWKNPGDSGLKPELSWRFAEGVKAGELLWPAPELFTLPGPVTSYSYSNQVLLSVPVEIPAEYDEQLFNVGVKLDWLVCKVDCLPGSADLTLSLPVAKSALPSEWRSQFRATEKRIPVSGTAQSSYEVSDSFLLLTVTGLTSDELSSTKVYFFPEEPGLIDPSAVQRLSVEGDRLSLKLDKAPEYMTDPAELKGVLKITLADNRSNAYELQAVVEMGSVKQIDKTVSGLQIFSTILFAFLGGVLLNLMPCVFPVLSIKILGLIKHREESLRDRLFHGLSFVLGILTSMWILAGALLILKNGGSSLGWGFQLQSPVFVSLLVVLFFLLALYFAGFLEGGSKIVSIAGKVRVPEGHAGSFLSGLLTTVVATPCTAPFMGSAIAFSFLLTPLLTMLVFTALGLGVATPYIILITFPGLISRLPKPGEWMNSLKQLLAFLMVATALWLLHVLGVQAGITGVFLIMTGLLFLGMGFWFFTLKIKGKLALIISRLLAVTFFICFVTSVFLVSRSGRVVQELDSELTAGGQKGAIWVAYSPQKVKELKKEGRVIFFDFTASWCLTCQVNKLSTLSDGRVKEAFKKYNVATVRADWTNKNSEIGEALERYERVSVPLNVIYNPLTGEEEILPTLLTPELVVEALRGMKYQDSD